MPQEKFLLLFILTFLLFLNPSLSGHTLTSPSTLADEVVLNGGSNSNKVVFSVEHFGAIGHGNDDTKAFEAAWEKACSTTSPSILLVPKHKTYKIKPVEFKGPCGAPVTVLIKGRLEAPSKLWYAADAEGRESWIKFNTITNLAVGGGGTLDGKGQVWWKNSCKTDPSLPCHHAPTALLFRKCNNLVLENIRVEDGQQIHVWFRNCTNVYASKISISSPHDSPNTDGIHVADTENIIIKDSIIKTGDDCISIVSGTRGLIATGIECGPGHGISIGSLGANNSSAQVSDVLVDTLKLKGTSNGVRIKTWQGGRGYVSNITFQNVKMDSVRLPIIIDQSYCDQRDPCHEGKSAVAVSNVHYKNIKGTSASSAAITFNCSRTVPCNRILLENVDLEGEGEGKGEEEDLVTSVCSNVSWKRIGHVAPTPCV